MKRALLLAVVAASLLVACGDESSTDTTTTSVGMSTVRVYFLRDGKVWPVARTVEDANVGSAVDALRAGPTEQEQAALGVTTAVPHLGANLERAGLAQLVYTMTQFPGNTAEIDGKTYTRADFEEQTPLILVESPLQFEQVSSPLRVTGTANTFEATFQYELVDSEGNVVDKNFVTATSGTGTRGTFDFTTGEASDVAKLVVFENSAEDGSRINEVEIPLTAAS